MKKQNSGESKLFLTELMIAIFFFAVISAVCIQAFSEAHAMSQESEELVQGVNAAIECGGIFYGMGWREAQLAGIFPEGGWEAENFQMEFDENWRPVEVAGVYVLNMKISGEDGLKKADIVVAEKESDKVIYQLEVERGK